jgi:very-short-patch-repair endonuclease
LRQYPICILSAFGRYLYYIPDFYCHQAKLVVEADGPIHLLKKEYDKNRDEALMSLNLTILRFKNDLILTEIQSVLNTIKEHL